jgi:hypothetical protein
MPKLAPLPPIPDNVSDALACLKPYVVEDHDLQRVELFHNLTDQDLRTLRTLANKHGAIAFPERDHVRLTWSDGTVRGVQRIGGLWFGVWTQGRERYVITSDGPVLLNQGEDVTMCGFPFNSFRAALTYAIGV